MHTRDRSEAHEEAVMADSVNEQVGVTGQKHLLMVSYGIAATVILHISKSLSLISNRSRIYVFKNKKKHKQK